jgi:hypothetical protein
MANENYSIVIVNNDNEITDDNTMIDNEMEDNENENENNNIINIYNINNINSNNTINNNRTNNNGSLLNNEYIKNYIKLVPLFIAKNDINKKIYINIGLFILVTMSFLTEIINLFINLNIFSFEFISYEHFLLFNVIFAEIIVSIRIIFQYTELPFEIIYIKYKLLCFIENVLFKMYMFSVFIILVHDLNEYGINTYNLVSKICIYLVFGLIVIYDYYLQDNKNILKEKYDNNNQEIIDEYIDCIENIMIEDNITIDIYGRFIEFDNVNNKSNSHETLSESPDNINCVICLEEFINNENVFISKCNHIYHKKCIIKWFLHNNSCPICREKLFR